MYTLAELCELVGGEVRGDETLIIRNFSTLELAGKSDITFLSNQKYLSEINNTQASAVITSQKLADKVNNNLIISSDPYLAFARILWVFNPQPAVDAKISISAVIDKSTSVSSSAFIGEYVVVGKNCYIGDNCSIGHGCVLEDDVIIADGTKIHANVTIKSNVALGENCIIESGVILGSDGFGYAPIDDGWFKIPQIGGVKIGNFVEVGANTTIDSGTLSPTVIADGVKLDNHIQIAHNVKIGENTAMAASTVVAGSTTIGKRCQIGGSSAIAGHITIADDVIVTGEGMVTKAITKKGVYSSGLPAVDSLKWRKTIAYIRNLEKIFDKVKKLESHKKN